MATEEEIKKSPFKRKELDVLIFLISFSLIIEFIALPFYYVLVKDMWHFWASIATIALPLPLIMIPLLVGRPREMCKTLLRSSLFTLVTMVPILILLIKINAVDNFWGLLASNVIVLIMLIFVINKVGKESDGFNFNSPPDWTRIKMTRMVPFSTLICTLILLGTIHPWLTLGALVVAFTFILIRWRKVILSSLHSDWWILTKMFSGRKGSKVFSRRKGAKFASDEKLERIIVDGEVHQLRRKGAIAFDD